MKKTLLAIALAAGTSMFAAQAPQTTPAPAKTTKAKKVRKHNKKHHKGSETNTAAPAQK